MTLHLSVSSISEESGTTTVRATLSHPSSEATTVTVSADPVSPALASDFDLSGSTLTVPRDGTVSEGSVTVTAVPNFVNAPNKTVTISGDAANTQGVVGDPPNLTLTIENDDVLGFPVGAGVAEAARGSPRECDRGRVRVGADLGADGGCDGDGNDPGYAQVAVQRRALPGPAE